MSEPETIVVLMGLPDIEKRRKASEAEKAEYTHALYHHGYYGYFVMARRRKLKIRDDTQCSSTKIEWCQQ